MNWKAIGIDTGTIYATGTHADCSRAVNETNRGELVKIMRADQAFEPMDDNAEIDRLAKEWQLMEAQAQRTRDRTAPTNPVSWTKEKDDFILENSDMNNTDLSDFFNKTFNVESSLSSIRNRLHKLRSDRGIDLTKGVVWRPEEDEYLLANYRNKSAKEIADHLGRTKGAVASRISIFVMQGLLERKKRR